MLKQPIKCIRWRKKIRLWRLKEVFQQRLPCICVKYVLFSRIHGDDSSFTRSEISVGCLCSKSSDGAASLGFAFLDITFQLKKTTPADIADADGLISEGSKKRQKLFPWNTIKLFKFRMQTSQGWDTKCL